MQCDLWEPRAPIAVGHGQLRRGYVVTVELCWSRLIAGTLVFSKEAPDILAGLARSLGRVGVLPEKLVWDREGAIHAGGGRPTDAFAGFCGQLGVGWVILDPADPQAKGILERSHLFMRTNFEPGRRFANHHDFQAQFDAWCDRVNRRVHRTTRAVPAERLSEERLRMRALPDRLPDLDRRIVVRVSQQPYLRIDRNDYSVDPQFAGRRVEVRVSQSAHHRWRVGHRRAGVPASSGVRRRTSRSPIRRIRPSSTGNALGVVSGTRSRSRSGRSARYDALIPA